MTTKEQISVECEDYEYGCATANEQYTQGQEPLLCAYHIIICHMCINIMLHGYDTTTYVRVSGGGRTGQGDDDSSGDELHGSSSSSSIV